MFQRISANVGTAAAIAGVVALTACNPAKRAQDPLSLVTFPNDPVLTELRKEPGVSISFCAIPGASLAEFQTNVWRFGPYLPGSRKDVRVVAFTYQYTSWSGESSAIPKEQLTQESVVDKVELLLTTSMVFCIPERLADFSERERRYFRDEFFPNVILHESRHAGIGFIAQRHLARQVNAHLKGPLMPLTVRDLHNYGKAAVNSINTGNEAYDVESQHGKKEGAVLEPMTGIPDGNL